MCQTDVPDTSGAPPGSGVAGNVTSLGEQKYTTRASKYNVVVDNMKDHFYGVL